MFSSLSRPARSPLSGRPDRLRAVLRNPLVYTAERWTPHPVTVRRAALAALVMSVVIVVTGGAVRLTGSGLGCDTWPGCTDESLVTTPEMGVHGVIEFGNRMLTYVLSAAVGWIIVAARAAKPRRPGLTRLAWAQFWVVMSNAVLGGVTVLTKLNPYIVAGHFLAATALITVAVWTWQRAREGDAAPRPLVGVPVRRLVTGLTALTGALIVAGTVVTGSGRHAGDSSEIERMPFGWEAVTRVHSGLAWAVLGGTLLVWAVMRLLEAPAGPRDRARELCAVLLAQGLVGYVQYATGEPEWLVGVHLLGSALVWIAALRLLLSVRERGPAPCPAAPRADQKQGQDQDQKPGQEQRAPAPAGTQASSSR